MDICAIVPVKRFDQAKSRLSSLLDKGERISLSSFLLQDTLKTLLQCHDLGKVIVVASDPSVREVTKDLGFECLFQPKDSGVNSAVKYADKFLSTTGSWASITIPCDLPLLLPEDIDGVCQLIPKKGASIILCPSYKFDGTNLLARNPLNVICDTRYDNDSFLGHLEASIKSGANTKIMLSTRLMIDLDTPEDLRLILTKNSSAKKAISYLCETKKNQFVSSSSSSASTKTKATTKTKKNARTTTFALPSQEISRVRED